MSYRHLQNDIACLADGGGSAPMQTKATIKMTKSKLYIKDVFLCFV